MFHLAPVLTGEAQEPFRAGDVSLSSAAIVTRDVGLGNLAILPVDSEGVAVRRQKGETSPAVGWYGVLGEFPAWDVTLQVEKALPARLDAVLFPLSQGEVAHPAVERLLADEAVTAFRIRGAGVDDTFVLCEQGAGPVSVGSVSFEGRALCVRRGPGLRVLGVDVVSAVVDGQRVEVD